MLRMTRSNQASDLLLRHWQEGRVLAQLPEALKPSNACRRLCDSGAPGATGQGNAPRLENRGNQSGRPAAHQCGRPARRSPVLRAGIRERLPDGARCEPHAGGGAGVRISNGPDAAAEKIVLRHGGGRRGSRCPAPGHRDSGLRAMRTTRLSVLRSSSPTMHVRTASFSARRRRHPGVRSILHGIEVHRLGGRKA